MASAINRTAIYLNLAAFLLFGGFCILTQAPIIQEDILKRSQEALSSRGISVKGLSVSGRDVVLNGFPESEIMNSQTHSVVAEVTGVRAVRSNVLRETETAPQQRDVDPGETAQQQEVQERIDHRLDNQKVTFKADSAVLTPESEKLLDEISGYLSDAPSLRCEIRGYGTEPRAAEEGGGLALRRALTTEDYLISKGIAEWRLSTHAFGPMAGARIQPSQGRRSDLMIDLVVKAR